jgi:hypothetical protein
MRKLAVLLIISSLFLSTLSVFNPRVQAPPVGRKILVDASKDGGHGGVTKNIRLIQICHIKVMDWQITSVH